MTHPGCEAITVPDDITAEWVQLLQHKLEKLTRLGVDALKSSLTQQSARIVLERAEAVFKQEKTLLELHIANPKATVTVVGDTHGQYHDVCKLFAAVGHPCDENYFIFNGDFVDRGAWGFETLLLLLCWKLALPHRVFLLRGNHESATCTVIYGFKEELKAKYGRSVWQEVYTRCKRVFANLPLAALIQQQALVLHGGLFRSPPQTSKLAKNKRKRANPILLDSAPLLGTLDDMRSASKGGMDPTGMGSNRLASDVLWSDPSSTPGFEFNASRGIGMTFGPDVTERFLRDNGLKLILRSHEGPDAREGREDMAPMTEGYTIDHNTPCGRLLTVFSAPEYPQFVGDESERCHNRAAVAVLSAPDYVEPRMVQFDADLPRPEAQPYYALDLPGSDEEYEPASSDASGMTSISDCSTAAAVRSEAFDVSVVEQPPQTDGCTLDMLKASSCHSATVVENGEKRSNHCENAGFHKKEQVTSMNVLELFQGVRCTDISNGS